MDADASSQTIEQACQISEIQDGVSMSYNILPGIRRLVCNPQPQRCLLPNRDTSLPQKISLICFHSRYPYRVLLWPVICPRVFSKLMVVVAAYHPHLGITVFPDLNDWFIKGWSYQEIWLAVQTNSLFQSLSLQINLEKSIFDPLVNKFSL